jgi:NAD(P)-dependent dehydrogenase (short-subunit alcohol dehydrogenase family)
MKVKTKMLSDNKVNELSQKKLTALITGASGGIGHATALKFANLGIKVVLVGRNESKLLEIQQEVKLLGGSAEYIVVDFLNQNSVAKLMDEVQSRKIVPDILINALGGVFESKDWSDENIYRNVYRLNTEVAIELTSKFFPLMSEYGGGRIIHFGSLSTKTGINSLPYVVAKSALISFVRFAANRFAANNSNVIMSAIAPGPISVPGKYLSKLESESPEKLLNWFEANDIPTKRLVRIEEVVNLITFLIAETGNYMNGSVIEIDGGAL